MPPHGFFTLGHTLARVWQPAYPLLPWALTSALLMTAGMWDFWAHGGRIEWVVVGLAAYEFMMGLLEEPTPAATTRAAFRSSRSGRGRGAR